MRLPSEQGLTLAELLVAIAVLSLIVTVGVPNYQRFSARNEVATEVLRLQTALAMTRNTAITRRSVITLCPSVDLESCSVAAGWHHTLVIFEGRGESGDTMLRTFGETRLVSLTYRNDNRPVRYTPLGRAGWHNGTFRLCGRLETGARVVVSTRGRVRSENERPECPEG